MIAADFMVRLRAFVQVRITIRAEEKQERAVGNSFSLRNARNADIPVGSGSESAENAGWKTGDTAK
jgi:hypothetical protein